MRITAESMGYYRSLLDELLALESGLTEWEVDFVDDLSRWEGAFTEKQAETLEKIYERRT